MTDITIVTIEQQHLLAARTRATFPEVPTQWRTDMYHLLT